MSLVDTLSSAAKAYAQSNEQQSAWGQGVQGFGMPTAVRGATANAAIDAPASYVVGGPAAGNGSMVWVVLGVAGVVLVTVLVARAL